MCDPSFLAAGVASATIVLLPFLLLSFFVFALLSLFVISNLKNSGYFERECCATMFLNYLASGATG